MLAGLAQGERGGTEGMDGGEWGVVWSDEGGGDRWRDVRSEQVICVTGV